MICEDCENRKERIQDGGRKVFCLAFGEELGSAQSVNDPDFGLKYHRKITACEAYKQDLGLYAPKATIEAAKEKIFHRDERPDSGHPFGG